MNQGVASAVDRLRAIHEALWDDAASLVRLPPGAVPALDLTAIDLHAVRETALGAFLDLGDGRAARAQRALSQVLEFQYRSPHEPWNGTFKVTAEEPAPSGGARAWHQYDPNWRQFLGCILAYTIERYASELPQHLVDAVEQAVSGCVIGEPDGRIPAWYTNPLLMHAWLCGWIGRRRNDSAAMQRAQGLLDSITSRLDQYGDVDEYNSPTYDGVDLLAVALWCVSPPTASFEQAGRRIARAIGSRLSTVFHPGLAAICGPHIRAYGLELDRYVSLAGQWLALAGADCSRVLPFPLDAATPHVHDLYFLPMLASSALPILGHLQIETVSDGRRHEQRFDSVVAVSQLAPPSALGCERGRTPRFARDQYVPFTAHFGGDPPGAVGVKLADATASVDAIPLGETSAVLRASAKDDTVELVVIFGDDPSRDGAAFRLGRLTLQLEVAPDQTDEATTSNGTEVRLLWRRRAVELEAAIAAASDPTRSR
ncbi:MAG: hypothetical protein JO265_10225 [Acidimicrobiia bacterium]|nr:hypothetical protein [Acidimicrobiia bacterium]